MNRTWVMTGFLTITLAGTLSAAPAGGTQSRTCAGDRKRDGSCQTMTTTTPTRSRLRDGSCQTSACSTQDRQRQRLRDGSCTNR